MYIYIYKAHTRACSSGGHAVRLGTSSMTKRYCFGSGLDERIERSSAADGRPVNRGTFTQKELRSCDCS